LFTLDFQEKQEKAQMVWCLHHPRMKNLCGWSRSFQSMKMRYLCAPFSTSRLNFNLCSKDSHPYTDKEYMDFREGRSFIWLILRSHEWISIRSHMNCCPIHFPANKMKFQNLVETGGVRHAKVLWMINIFGSNINEHIELFMWLKVFTA
jgi:hypothetical protein